MTGASRPAAPWPGRPPTDTGWSWSRPGRARRGIVPDVPADGEALWQRRIAERPSRPRGSSAFSGGVPRLRRLRDDGDPASPPPTRSGRRTSTRLPADWRRSVRGVRRGPDRHDHHGATASGPHPGPPGGAPGGRTRRHSGGAQATMNRDHVLAGIAEALRRRRPHGRSATKVTTPLDAPDFDIPDDFGGRPPTSPRDRRRRPGGREAGGDGRPRQSDAADSWFLAMDDAVSPRPSAPSGSSAPGHAAEGVPFLESIWA